MKLSIKNNLDQSLPILLKTGDSIKLPSRSHKKKCVVNKDNVFMDQLVEMKKDNLISFKETK